MVDPRFSQLLDLAREGDEASVAQLWHEFNFDFHAEVPPLSDLAVHSPIRAHSRSFAIKNSSFSQVSGLSATCHLSPDTRTPEGGVSC